MSAAQRSGTAPSLLSAAERACRHSSASFPTSYHFTFMFCMRMQLKNAKKSLFVICFVLLIQWEGMQWKQGQVPWEEHRMLPGCTGVG